MMINRGRILFYAFIWIYALVYYVECTNLAEFTEKITISVAFWLMTLFVIIEIVSLLKIEKSYSGFLNLPARFWKTLLSEKRIHLSLMVVAYLTIIPYLGFYVSSGIAYVSTSKLLGTKGIWGNLLAGSLVLSVIFLFFSVLLQLNLPKGLLI